MTCSSNVSYTERHRQVSSFSTKRGVSALVSLVFDYPAQRVFDEIEAMLTGMRLGASDRICLPRSEFVLVPSDRLEQLSDLGAPIPRKPWTDIVGPHLAAER